MGTVTQLQMSTRVLHSPRRGPDVCVDCFNLTRGFSKCFACSRLERHLSAMVPISYSVGHEYLHHILADYKRARGAQAVKAGAQVGAILSLFLDRHEGCVAQASGVNGFALVTTVPSSDPRRDEDHPLRRIVARLQQTQDRHERVLRRTLEPAESRAYDSRRYIASRCLDGENVLLIDDTWTTGANAQSAAAALRSAGAGAVAAVVIGRHVNREWHENDGHLDALPFDWNHCALCNETAQETSDRASRRTFSGPAERLQRAA